LDKRIFFNGAGDDAHETFCLYRVRPPKEEWEPRRGRDFCKTARKPYDLAVTAALCYLATVTDPISHSVSSDGHGKDFLDGFAEARRALPRYANILDIPMGILRSDRWCMPWVSCYASSGFNVNFCVDGKGYVEHIKTGDCYCFETHLALAQFLDKTKEVKFPRRLKVRFGAHVDDVGSVEPNIWNSYGSFDEARHKRIATAQAFALPRCSTTPATACRSPPPTFAPVICRSRRPNPTTSTSSSKSSRSHSTPPRQQLRGRVASGASPSWRTQCLSIRYQIARRFMIGWPKGWTETSADPREPRRARLRHGCARSTKPPGCMSAAVFGR
jgi:hypothetical protein